MPLTALLVSYGAHPLLTGIAFLLGGAVLFCKFSWELSFGSYNGSGWHLALGAFCGLFLVSWGTVVFLSWVEEP